MPSQDQVITTSMAYGLQADAYRARTRFGWGARFGWTVLRNQPDYPGQIIARFTTERPTAYVLRGDTLAELRQQIPAGLDHSNRQPDDPPEVVEI